MDLDRVELLAKLEKVLDIPEKERLTEWYGDYALYEPKLDVKQTDIDRRIGELNKQIVHGNTVTVEVKGSFSRRIEVENAEGFEEAVNMVKERFDKQGFILDAEDVEQVSYNLTEQRRNRMQKRLFVDLDGTCAVWQPVAEEQLFEKGYYRNLPEYENVVAAVNHIVEHHPEMEVFILSKYLTNSDYALQEKDEWVSEHLPGIDKEHRIFVPYEMDKRDMIPGQLRETDYLLDDYTKNFDNWQPPARGIKLLNGINHTKGTWQDDRISMMRNPEDLADSLVRIIEKGERILDQPVQNTSSLQMEEQKTLDEAIDQALEAAEAAEFELEI